MKLVEKLRSLVQEREINDGLINKLATQFYNKCVISAEHEAREGERELKILVSFEGSSGGYEHYKDRVIARTEALLESEGLRVTHKNENYEDYLYLNW